MNNLPNSESALEKFAKKIDFANLDGKPEDFYKAGLTFVENGQFDDGIIEFVKIIKTATRQDLLFTNSVKELKSMGFSTADISTITEFNETVEKIDAEPNTTTTALPTSNSSGVSPAAIITISIVLLFVYITIFSDTSPEGYERSGNLVFAAMVMSPLLIFIALLGLIPAVIASKKGHNFLLWWFIGVVLPIVVSLPLAFFVKPITKEIEQNQK